MAFERQLRLNLDKTLSFLDLCDMQSKEQDSDASTNDNKKSVTHKFNSKKHMLDLKRSVALQKADAQHLHSSYHYI